MTTTDLAINESLAEMQVSLSADLQMLRNYRAFLVKSACFERIDMLKTIESGVEKLLEDIASAIRR
jgi:hypothetical protein